MTTGPEHVPDERLLAFVAADLAEDAAVQVALHLDACPRCATRAATLDPLAAAFAAVPDPLVPPDLVFNALMASEEPDPGPRIEIALGTALLVLAAVLAMVVGDPVAVASRLAVIGRALWTGGGQLAAQLGPTSLGLAVSTAISVTLALVAARAALPEGRLS